MEFSLCGREALPEHRFVDTLTLARQRHPNSPNSLDALCARYAIDASARTKHGALIDAKILAEVYIELLGGRQTSLTLTAIREVSEGAAAIRIAAVAPPSARSETHAGGSAGSPGISGNARRGAALAPLSGSGRSARRLVRRKRDMRQRCHSRAERAETRDPETEHTIAGSSDRALRASEDDNFFAAALQ